MNNYIHREIIFDDPKTLRGAFYLAKFYEERWKTPFSEISKPKLLYQYQIQIQKKFINRNYISITISNSRFRISSKNSNPVFHSRHNRKAINRTRNQKIRSRIINRNSRSSEITDCGYRNYNLKNSTI
ncbi:hypothetical protein AAHE18_16G212500 [Arachis hypogaea]